MFKGLFFNQKLKKKEKKHLVSIETSKNIQWPQNDQ